MNFQLGDIGQVIQLAIAPVFLLAGVSILLILLTNRLGRIIDQMRLLEDRAIKCVDAECVAALSGLHRRSSLINIAIAASTLCGLLVCLVIAMLFLGDATGLPLSDPIYDPDDYSPARQLGHAAKRAGCPGLRYNSVRSPGNHCWALMTPKHVKSIVQTAHYEMIWSGQITSVSRLSNP